MKNIIILILGLILCLSVKSQERPQQQVVGETYATWRYEADTISVGDNYIFVSSTDSLWVETSDGGTGYEWYCSVKQFSEGGTGVVDITYANLMTAISTESLVAGSLYRITNRGDRWIMFQALNDTLLATDGQRLMLCPSDYASETDAYGNVWLGVWNSGLTPASGNLVIWGGLVWENQTGVVGTASDDVTLDGTNWTVISKASFSNWEYTEILFGCQYDFVNDYFIKQWDGFDNVVCYNINEDTYNGCDVTDWNYSTSGYIMTANHCRGIFNNSVSGNIVNNLVKYYIYDNGSNVTSIGYNIAQNIYGNDNVGSIEQNLSLSDIELNTNNGAITYNQTQSYISTNSNAGEISYNFCAAVDNNSNAGEIQGNDLIGAITTNSNSGIINNNSNSGDISTNSVVGYISYNKNNGSITSCDSGTDPCNITYNGNNGSISGTYAADVTDAVVNK